MGLKYFCYIRGDCIVNGNGLHNEKMIDDDDYVTQDHLKIIEMVLQVNNKKKLDLLYVLTKSILKKSNSL